MHSATESDMVAAKLKDFISCGKKIIGAGLNYKSVIAWKKLPTPAEPSIFLKPTTSYIEEDQCILIPDGCLNVVQEVELGVVIGKKGRNIKEEDAYDYVGGYCLALDMTDAGFLDKCRKQGLPWTVGKGWDTSCPVSRFICKKELPNPQNVRLYCKINCKTVQGTSVMMPAAAMLAKLMEIPFQVNTRSRTEKDASTCDMLFQIPKLISYVSEFMTLEPCDLLLTGTPCGSTSVKPGDRIECGLGDIVAMDFEVKAEC